MDEFQESCTILSRHINSPISAQYIHDMARSIDINKDGFIDFNEFLEAFRIVDFQNHNQQIQRSTRYSSESEDNAEMFEVSEDPVYLANKKLSLTSIHASTK